jgi:hypothetical protein
MRNDDDAVGHAAATPSRWIPGHEHQEHLVTALRAWLSAENRCFVPANSFAEYALEPNPETKKKDVVFALSEDRPLFAFGGLWTTFNGDRGTKSKPVPVPHQVYGFLTTEPNAAVEPIQPEGDAGNPDINRRARRVDARAMG